MSQSCIKNLLVDALALLRRSIPHIPPQHRNGF